ncbi:MAG: VanZ family protein, partial [Vicinamibacterales bacterium]
MTLAVLAATAVIVSAPFVGQLRAALRAAFPGRFVTIVGGAVALAIAAAVALAIARIGERRAARYGAIAAALGLGAAYIALFSTGRPDVDVVERVHFVEYGLITLLFYRAWRPRNDLSVIALPILAGLLVGTLEEGFQWFLPVRVGEARDVFLNLTAIACGLLFSLGLAPPASFAYRFRRGSVRLVSGLVCGFVLVFAAFVHAVHLGVEVRADAIGSFRSRYDRAALSAHARDRAERWREQPPIVLRRLSREDQYMDEGLWHVRRRNDAWAADDFFTAWRENRILEEFFAPVLEAPSYVSKSGHRWPPEQRADAERRAAAGERPYVSDAEPRPILL